jgi:hypothetical protein
MHVRILSVLMFSMLLMGAGCSGVTDERPAEELAIGGEEMADETMNIEESTFEEDGAVVTIKKNVDTNEASVHVVMELADDEEYVDFLGDTLTAAPMAVNLACGLYQYAFFDEEGLAEVIAESGGAMQEPQNDALDAELGDATVILYELMFLDAEDGKTIATCSATGAGPENIEFNAMRDYPEGTSLFDMEIGVLAF